MKRLLFTAALLIAAAPLAIAQTTQGAPSQPDAAQNQTKPSVEGVWKVAEVVTPGATPADKATTITSPQPGLLIFTKSHYSSTLVTGGEARPATEPPKDPQHLTDAEKLARYEQWSRFAANAGTYEIKGSTIIRRPMVAKNPNVMDGTTPITSEYKLDGANTLWLTPTGDRAATEPRVKYTRVE
jgi:hypothetical protein